LVTQDHVVAIVGDSSNVDAVWGNYVASTGVPVVGGQSINAVFFTNADFYPTGPNPIASIYAQFAVTANAGGHSTAALYCAEEAECAQLKLLYQGFNGADGIKTGPVLPVSATASDYTAVCQAIKSSGVSSYSVASFTSAVIRVYKACATQGVKAVLSQNDGTVSPSLLGVVKGGFLGIDDNVPYFVSSTPATKAYRSFLAQYAPSVKGTLDDPNAQYVYIAGQLFEATIKAANVTHATNVTSATVKKGLYSLKGVTLGGLTQPLTYVPGKPTMLNCWFNVGIQGNKFTTPKGLKPECASNAVINGVLKKLGA